MGASWHTTLFGALTLIGDAGAFISHFMKDNPVPITPEDMFKYFMGLAMGLGLIFAKSFNVSNSKDPAAPIVVPPAAAVTVNPAAKPQ